MDLSGLKIINALNHIPQIGSQRIHKLLNFFKSPDNIWKADFLELQKSGIGENAAKSIIDNRGKLNPELLWSKIEKNNIKVCFLNDENYPQLLKQIYNPPILLYYQGILPKNDDPLIAIVGTRRCTSYGKSIAPVLTRDLVANNISIVSGLAFGIDAIAHQAALEANGKTYAILGSSIDANSIYPAENRFLAQKIVKCNGAIISEYPPETAGAAFRFPMRNRIMAGMALGTLVIEGAIDSGSMITANLALEYNRDVFALPGDINRLASSGPNSLIKKGAKAITCVQDILDEFDFKHLALKIQAQKYEPENSDQKAILELLSQEPLHIDQIIQKTKLETQTVNSTLTILEIKNIIKNLGNMTYIRIE